MLVVPISFVTEHIETLHEINIEARIEAKNVGIETFRMMPAVGDSPLFIGALKDLVLRGVGMEAGRAAPQPSALASERRRRDCLLACLVRLEGEVRVFECQSQI